MLLLYADSNDTPTVGLPTDQAAYVRGASTEIGSDTKRLVGCILGDQAAVRPRPSEVAVYHAAHGEGARIQGDVRSAPKDVALKERANHYVVGPRRKQMYKNRFAKWGFQKNSRRSTTRDRGRTGVSRKPSPTAEPGLDRHDRLMLMVLSSVRICSVAFFESVQPRDGPLASLQQRPERTKEISFTFKLVTDLLDRGHGDLAGRTARKAFLLLEDMLTLEGPALVWNLLEMMYHMVTLRHAQLFQMLLAHLIALVDGSIPKTHPLPTMLSGLRGLLVSLTSVGSLSSLLERAWILNAEILFNHFDPSLFKFYCCVHWDSCSITPSRYLRRSDPVVQPLFSSASLHRRRAPRAESRFQSPPVEEDTMLQHLLAPRIDSSAPRDYEMLRTSSIAALREHGGSMLCNGVDFTGNTTTLLRILAGLVIAKTLEEWPIGIESSGIASTMKPQVPRVHADGVACALRTLMDLNTERDGDGLKAPSDAVEQIRSIIALREYARGKTDPQVVQDMWLLEDALIAAGKFNEAEEVGQTAFRRLKKYIQDIPVNSA